MEHSRCHAALVDCFYCFHRLPDVNINLPDSKSVVLTQQEINGQDSQGDANMKE